MAECEHPDCHLEAVYTVTTIAVDNVDLCDDHSSEVLAHRVYPDWFLALIEKKLDRNGHDG